MRSASCPSRAASGEASDDLHSAGPASPSTGAAIPVSVPEGGRIPPLAPRRGCDRLTGNTVELELRFLTHRQSVGLFL